MTLAPFRGFWDMQSEVGRLFNDMVGDLLGRRRREGFARERLWAPRLEAFAREGDLVIHADLPGVALDDVDITLEGTTLTISGERKLPAAGDGIDLGWSEEDLAEVRRVLRPVVSLENEDLERGEFIVDPGADDPAEVSARNDARRRLAEALSALPERRSAVLSTRFGLDGRPRSLAAVGEDLGVSRERVRQLAERGALRAARAAAGARVGGLAA